MRTATDSRAWLRVTVSTLFVCAIAGVVLTALFGFEQPKRHAADGFIRSAAGGCRGGVRASGLHANPDAVAETPLAPTVDGPQGGMGLGRLSDVRGSSSCDRCRPSEVTRLAYTLPYGGRASEEPAKQPPGRAGISRSGSHEASDPAPVCGGDGQLRRALPGAVHSVARPARRRRRRPA